MEDYIIKSRWVYSPTGNIIDNAMIVVEQGKITFVGNQDSGEQPSGMEIYSFPKGLVTPPFINSHTHISETLIRGICDDADLHEWLYDHVWKVEPKMFASDARIGAQLAAAEMIYNGTIGFIDQYFYADEIAKVVDETGLKALICPSIFEGNPETKTIEAAYKKNLQIVEKWHKKDNRILVGFGPHAPYSVSDEYYQKIYTSAEKYDTKIHTHLNETKKEVADSLSQFGKSPIEKMADLGVLDRIIAAHCIHLSEKDKLLLHKNEVSVLHCIQSNLKIAAGVAEIPELLDRGINVCLGTDGNASNNNLDMLEEVRLTAMIHKGLNYDPKIINTKTALEMATINPSQILGDVYSGKIEEDQQADLLVINLDRLNTTPIINPLSNWIYSGNQQNIAMTISNGKILYQDGKFLTLDIEDIKRKAQKSIERMMVDAEYTVEY